MAAKRTKRLTVTGRRGPRGKTGKAGPPGPTGPAGNHSPDMVRLTAQVHQILADLQVQLTRIAQIQAQLDRLASGMPESGARTEGREH